MRFQLASAREVTPSIHGVQGGLVRRLATGIFAAGPHAVRWDGRGERGETVPGGVYFLRARTPGAQEEKRVLVVR